MQRIGQTPSASFGPDRLGNTDEKLYGDSGVLNYLSALNVASRGQGCHCGAVFVSLERNRRGQNT